MIIDPDCSNRKKKPRVSDLDALILEEIGKLAADPAAFDALKNDPEAPEEKAGPVSDRLGEIEKQINRLLNLYQTGVMDLEELQPRLADLKEERGRLSELLQGLEEETAGKLSKSAALEVASAFPAAVASGDPDELRALIRALIEKVVYNNGEMTIYWKFN